LYVSTCVFQLVSLLFNEERHYRKEIHTRYAMAAKIGSTFPIDLSYWSFKRHRQNVLCMYILRTRTQTQTSGWKQGIVAFGVDSLAT